MASTLLDFTKTLTNLLNLSVCLCFGKAKSQRRQFDLIQDKGKGIILLLHGGPGVEKTSTTETVIKVTREHFTKIADVSNEFNYYLWRTKHQRNDEAMNRRNENHDAFAGGVPFGATPMAPNVGVQLYQSPHQASSGMLQFHQQQQPPPPGMPQGSSSMSITGFNVPQAPMQAPTMPQVQPIGRQPQPSPFTSKKNYSGSQVPGTSQFSPPQPSPQIMWSQQGMPLPQTQSLPQQGLQQF
ncbi:uncharacterized protein BCR38DRAFT_491407 [Pseudomassariella vexata]|uniref:Uncharacterized protein n=1 Tax=Pseudomassariella vexata TaxID=1141098 RepID=A0A1Y2D5Y4_9PEZI|nr:uncharacterized protein BCR38DRAFT_491407 [Pseudomassariella vexata]ORY54719.1 hypothetical protein BCR38DRAFT_491407 [Pseudomassariella vexata]